MGIDHWDGTHKYWAEKYLAELQEARAQLAAARKKLAEAAHILRGLLGETKRVRADQDDLIDGRAGDALLLQHMDEAWEAASPGNLRAWVPALLEEVRRLRAQLPDWRLQSVAGCNDAARDIRRAALEEAAKAVEAQADLSTPEENRTEAEWGWANAIAASVVALRALKGKP